MRCDIGLVTNEQKLETQISEALSAYLVAGERIARAAVERALGSGDRMATAVPAKNRRSNRAVYSRRSSEEIARLCDELCTAVSTRPGESMATLGEPPSRLTTVVARLKQQGRIRTAGSRQFTRYFPATASSLESAA